MPCINVNAASVLKVGYPAVLRDIEFPDDIKRIMLLGRYRAQLEQACNGACISGRTSPSTIDATRPMTVDLDRLSQRAKKILPMATQEYQIDFELIQELIEDGIYAVTRYKPEGDNLMRLHAQTGTIENGFVYLPHEAHWLPDYLHELTTFPGAKYDDQVDSTSQAIASHSRLENPRVLSSAS